MSTTPQDFRALFKKALLRLEELESKLASVEASRTDPIAVVGLACRFPGGANDPEAFWRLLRDGKDAVIEVPPDRWDVDEYYDPEPGTPGKTYTRNSGFLDRVDAFDPHFFGIAPREALSMDPQQRLLLEVIWEALENSGHSPAKLLGSSTGVFVGITGTDYSQVYLRASGPERIDTYFGSGVAHSIASGRLSYVLGLQGPSLSVDTACSSSLVAVHLACQSIRTGDCRMAIAGGVGLILLPDGSITASQARMLSPDGRCKAFDASADGYGRAEGCGLVVLKRLSDAVASGDNVLAVIKGSALNQDGRSSGLTAPNGPAQEAVIREVLARAGVEGADVDYVEAHGTGTSLGDPIEVRALGAVLGPGRAADRPLGLGSVKSNIGHLEAAAGIAGLIKMVLALQHEELPPHLHFRKPNPFIPWDKLPIRVVTERTPWRRGARPRRAGVSSFGFSGTNAHILLEEAPTPRTTRTSADRPLHLMTVSARTETALGHLAEGYAAHLEAAPALDLGDAAFTTNIGRSHFTHRAAVVAASVSEAAVALRKLAAGADAPGLVRGQVEGKARPEIAFLFTGQGSQYSGMGRRLYETEPTFKAALDRCDEQIRALRGQSLLAVMQGEGPEAGALDETEWTQPALFAVEFALAELWRSWGIVPSLVAGHSIGEYVAACVAGVFSVEDALRLVAERGRLMQALPKGGTMAAVFASEARVAETVARHAARLGLAAVNAPDSVVLSGDTEVLQGVLRELQSGGVRAKLLNVSHAFHSPLMEPMLAAFEAVASSVTFAGPRLGVISNVTGRLAGPRELETPGYWRRHVREAVRFAAGVETLSNEGATVFVEVGPSPTLTGLAQRSVPEGFGLWVPSLRKGKDDWRSMLEGLAALHVHGVDVDFGRFDAGYGRRRVALPTYPFERERYWVEAGPVRKVRDEEPTVHPLLGRRLRSALSPAQFEVRLSAGSPAFLGDHRFFGNAVLPAAAYAEMGLAAGREVFGPGNLALTDLEIAEALVLPETGEATLQVIVTPDTPRGGSLAILSLANDGSWRSHAAGKIVESSAAPLAGLALSELRARVAEAVSVTDYYRRLEETGVAYGPAFRGIESLWRGEGEALGRLLVPPNLDVRDYRIHPALLDAAFQVIGAALPAAPDEAPLYMPTGIGAVRLFGDVPASAWAHVSVAADGTDGVKALLRLFDDAGRTVAEISGLRLRRVRRESVQRAAPRGFGEWLYELAWRPAPLAVSQAAVGSVLVLADRQGTGEALAALLRKGGHRVVVATAGPSFEWSPEGDRAVLDGRNADEFEVLLARTGALKAVVHAWALDVAEPGAGPLLEAQQDVLGSVLSLLKVLDKAADQSPPRLFLVTRGSQPVGATASPIAIAQATLWGLGRSLALEHPALRCVRVDLDPDGGGVEALAAEVGGGDSEDQVAYRGGERHVARLARLRPQTPAQGKEDAVRVQIAQRGILDNLIVAKATRQAPASGEVEIEIAAAGLNFRDVLNALGMYPGDAGLLGSECAGRVVAVGEGVKDLKPGDEVVALGGGTLGSHVTTPSYFVAPRPLNLSATQAAAVPLVFLTARYGLDRLAGMKAGDRVLVHAAAGGVGLAAVQLAQRAGAEVFATAGSDRKREHLRSLGVRHVMDSRSVAFADEVLALTNGEGVDIVLNSLVGEFIPKGLSVLRPGGHFLEIGKREIWDAARVAAVNAKVTYAAYDLAEAFLRDGVLARTMLHELMADFASGALRPLPIRAFALGEAAEAFRFMAQARHVGKIVLVTGRGTGDLVRADRTYVVTGGLGGLGLAVAGWLVGRGARHLLLVGRSGAPASARPALEALETAGAEVRVVSADVSRPEGVALVMAKLQGSMPPLAGVVHAAGVIEDGVLVKQDWPQFARVMAPKVEASWRLHRLTLDHPLDFFVLFSSVASLLGSPGQGNYAAGNAFLDALAHFRRRAGLPALTVNWGPWAEVGLAAALGDQDQRRRVGQGVGLIPPLEGTGSLEHLLETGATQATVLPVDWAVFARRLGADLPPVYLEMAAEGRGRTARGAAREERGLAVLLEGIPADERPEAVAHHVRDQVLRVLGLDASHTPGPDEGFTDIGMDSLMSVELRNRLQSSLGRPLPSTLAFEHPTLRSLTAFLVGEMGLEGRVPVRAKASAPPPPSPTPDNRLDQLSADELEASLLDELKDAGY